MLTKRATCSRRHWKKDFKTVILNNIYPDNWKRYKKKNNDIWKLFVPFGPQNQTRQMFKTDYTEETKTFEKMTQQNWISAIIYFESMLSNNELSVGGLESNLKLRPASKLCSILAQQDYYICDENMCFCFVCYRTNILLSQNEFFHYVNSEAISTAFLAQNQQPLFQY